jgi:hypothetical protein
MSKSKQKKKKEFLINSAQNIDLRNNIYAEHSTKKKSKGVGSQRKRHSQRNIFFRLDSSGSK